MQDHLRCLKQARYILPHYIDLTAVHSFEQLSLQHNMSDMPPPHGITDDLSLDVDVFGADEASESHFLSFIHGTLLNDSLELSTNWLNNPSTPQQPLEWTTDAVDSPAVIMCSHDIASQSQGVPASVAPRRASPPPAPAPPERVLTSRSAANAADVPARLARVREKNRRGQKAFRERTKVRVPSHHAQLRAAVASLPSQTSNIALELDIVLYSLVSCCTRALPTHKQFKPSQILLCIYIDQVAYRSLPCHTEALRAGLRALHIRNPLNAVFCTSRRS